MKRIFYYVTCLAAVALMAVSCDKTSGEDVQDPPVLTIVQSSINVVGMGGDFELTYIVENPVENATVSAKATETWIENIDCSVSGKVTFSVPQYFESENRSAIISIEYSYGDGLSVTAQANVIQIATEYDHIVEMTIASGTYYGEVYSKSMNGTYQYYFWLHDTEFDNGYVAANGTYYLFDIWSSVQPSDLDNIILPAGVYTVGDAETDASIDNLTSEGLVVNATGDGYAEGPYNYASGTLTVSYEGNVMTAVADIVDKSGEKHYVTYSGEIPSLSNGTVFSTLTDDYVLDLSSAECNAAYYGDYYGTASANWYAEISNTDGNGDLIILDFCADASWDYSAGFPTGVFSGAFTAEAGTFVTGYAGYSYSWLINLINDSQVVCAAPLYDGTITITKDGDGIYTIDFDCLDDIGYTITGSWSGVPVLFDSSSVSSLAAKACKGTAAPVKSMYR